MENHGKNVEQKKHIRKHEKNEKKIWQHLAVLQYRFFTYIYIYIFQLNQYTQ